MPTEKIDEILFFLVLFILFATIKNKCKSTADSIYSRGDYTKAELLLSIGNSYKDTDLDSLIYYDSLALHESSVSMNTAIRAKILANIARNLYLLGNNIKSLTISYQALSLYSSSNDKAGMANCLNIMGVIYQNFGEYEEALRVQLKALEYYEELNDYIGIVKTDNNLGNFFKRMHDFHKSQNYYEEALQILDKNPDALQLARTYNNIGSLYFEKCDFKNSLQYEEKSLKIKKNINPGPNEMAESYLSLGNVFRGKKKFKEAEQQYKKGFGLALKIGNKNLQALYTKNMAELYELMKMNNKALILHRKSITLAKETNFQRIFIENLNGFARIYQRQGNYKLAFEYFKQARNKEDSLYSASLKTKLDKYRNQYDAVRRAQELQKLKSSRQKSISAWITAGLLLIIVLLIVIIIRYRTKNSLNSELIGKNSEIADLLGKLNDLNKNLSDSESTYRYLFERNPVAMFILEEENFRILAVNGSAIKQYGFSEEEFLELTFDRLWAEENTESFYDFQSCILSSPGKNTDGSHITKDGRTIFVEITGRPLIYKGKRTYYVKVSDETERKLIEQIVHESEERFRNLFEGSPDAIILVDAESERILDANPSASKLFRRSKEELLSLKHADLYPDEIREIAGEIFTGFTVDDGSGKKIGNIELEIELPDGIKAPVEITGKLTKISERTIYQCIFREISIRKITEAALIQSEKRLRKAQAIANVGNWEIDLKTGLVYGSEESALIFGLDTYLKNISFTEIKKLTLPEYRKELDAALGALIKERREFDVKFKIRKKDTGETRVLEARAELILDENNLPVKLMGAIRDVTELSNYQEQLILERKNAERSNRLKSDFLAQMSHEIRSPVNIIMSYAALIKDELNGQVNGDIKTCFAAIDTGGKRLIRTIDLILNMADIQLGKYEPSMEYTNLANDLLNNIVREYIPAAEAKGLKLNFINESVSARIYIDRYTVSQIFSNLIDNAIKYTHEGEVEVKIINSKNHIAVTVKDTGIGISEKYLPYVFDPFSQEDNGYARRFEGTGLGLSLVKKYCDLNEAQIFIESKKGNGTVFKIRFKCRN